MIVTHHVYESIFVRAAGSCHSFCNLMIVNSPSPTGVGNQYLMNKGGHAVLHEQLDPIPFGSHHFVPSSKRDEKKGASVME